MKYKIHTLDLKVNSSTAKQIKRLEADTNQIQRIRTAHIFDMVFSSFSFFFSPHFKEEYQVRHYHLFSSPKNSQTTFYQSVYMKYRLTIPYIYIYVYFFWYCLYRSEKKIIIINK